MSYTKVKSIGVSQNKVWITAASSNVRPITYHREELPGLTHMLNNDGRGAVDKYILYAYWTGELQGGNNNYQKSVSLHSSDIKIQYSDTCSDSAVLKELQDILYNNYTKFTQRARVPHVVYINGRYLTKITSAHMYSSWNSKRAKVFVSKEDAQFYVRNWSHVNYEIRKETHKEENRKETTT